MLEFISWYIVVFLLGFAALPLAFKFFHFLPERGYAFIKPFGLLTTGFVFWWLGSFGFLRNDNASFVIAAFAVLLVGALWLGRDGWGELRAWLKAEIGVVLALEILFLVAFAAWTYVRARMPDIVGTEKPMEFMFINSILRSPTFPPQDAWLSGHSISYYYFGYVLIAALTRITGVASSIGFNLGIALLFGLTAVGTTGVALNLIALVKSPSSKVPFPPAGRASGDREGGRNLLSSFYPALLAPLCILLAGNFYGVAKLANYNNLINFSAPIPRYGFGERSADNATLAQTPGFSISAINIWEWLDLKGANTPPTASPLPDQALNPGFWWWFSGARVMHDRNLIGDETEAIDEMPIFSFLLGDMHPHVLGLPFVFVAVALALQLLLWGYAHADTPLQLTGEIVIRILVAGVILGGLSFLNTWDFPIYWFVAVTAFITGLGLQWGFEKLLTQWKFVGAVVIGLALIGIALYLPFYFAFQSQAGGIVPNLIYPSRFQQTLVFFAHTLIGVAIWVGWLTWKNKATLDGSTAWWVGGGLVGGLTLVMIFFGVVAMFNPSVAAFVDQMLYPLTRDTALGLVIQRRLIDSLTVLAAAALIALPVGLLVGGLRKTEVALPIPVLFTLILVITGALLLLGPEFVYLRDNFGTRMNTIFKFYFQTWSLWGLAAAFGMWYMWHAASARAKWVMNGVMGGALLLSMVYSVVGVNSRMAEFGETLTLDGMAYFARTYPDDAAAIAWLNKNVSGAPVIVEGIGGVYWIEGRFSRISMATGLPTVMGWPGHENQWRGNGFGEVAGRETDVRQIYQVRDWGETQRLLDQYNVEYVILSALEMQKYQEAGGVVYTPKFEQYMRPVFTSGDVVIYQRLEGGR